MKHLLRFFTLTALCLASFALAGSASAASTASHERQAVYRYSMDLKDASADLSNRVRRQMIETIAHDIVLDACASGGEDEQSGSCQKDPIPDLYAAREAALTWSGRWPPRPEALALPPDPAASTAFGAASGEINEIQAVPGGAGLTQPVVQPEDMPLGAIRDAAAALPPVDAAEAAKRRRLSDLFELALSNGLAAGHVEVKLPVEKPFGEFAASAGETISGSVQSLFEGAVRKAAVNLALACRVSVHACREEAARMVNVVRNDPRLKMLTARLAAPARLLMARYQNAASSLSAQNIEADRAYRTAMDQTLAGEGEGPWGNVRARWSADLQNGRIDGLTPAEKRGWTQFFADWEAQKKELASAMIHRGWSGGEKEWTGAFHTWLKESAERAAIWGYVVLNDQLIRPYLVERQPSAVGKTIRVHDAYLLFTATIQGQAWSPNMEGADAELAHSFEFDKAVGIYCPHVKPATDV